MNTIIFNIAIIQLQSNDLFLIGDIEELGAWNINKAIKLSLTKAENDLYKASHTLNINNNVHHFKYKYFLGKYDAKINKMSIDTYEDGVRSYDCELNKDIAEAKFGMINSAVYKVHKGWLQQSEAEVYITLPNDSVNLFEANSTDLKYKIKCMPFYEEGRYMDNLVTGTCEDKDGNILKIVSGDMTLVKNKEDIVRFTIRTFDLSNLRVQFQVTSSINSLNSGFAMLIKLDEILDLNTITVPIICENKMIGELKVEILISKAFLNNFEFNINSANIPHTNCLAIGHRGCGKTFNKNVRRTSFLENTIESFNAAANFKQDMVEFDVLLTKDSIPVIFHDFRTALILSDECAGLNKTLDVPVNDLRYEELKKFQFGLKPEFGDPKATSFDRKLDYARQPFPKLEDLFSQVNENIAFNIEIKFPQLMEDGSIEDGLKHFFDRNHYLDEILKICLSHVGKRQMVFSSFDADVCHMLGIKQNLIPTMFLTSGTRHNYPLYKDLRTRSILAAVNHAHNSLLYGVVAKSTELLTSARMVDLAHSLEMKLFIWGEDNNSPDNRKHFQSIGVDGIIYDDVQLA